jgi:hypothetical protein
VAFLVSVGLFTYFWIIGFAVLGLLYRRDDLIRTILIAPAVGIVTVVYGNYLLSRSGFPIGSIAFALGAVLLVAAIAALLWRRPPLPGRRGLPYLFFVAVAFGANGWPLFGEGFAWLAGLNPDAANYILNADRFAHQAFSQPPDAQTWLSQADWGSYSVINALNGIRTGTDMLLAWVVTITGYDEPASYMPLLVALHVAALAAAAALVSVSYRFARLVSAGLLAVTALSTAGVALQLFGQELGLACLLLTCVLLLSPYYRLSIPVLARYAALAALAMAVFIVSYPEMLPFLGLGFLVHHGFGAREFRRYWRPALGSSVVIAVVTSGLLLGDAWGLVQFLFRQAESATSEAGSHADLFPYLLLPSGISALWGLRPYLPGPAPFPGDNFLILVGLALSGATLLGALWMIRRREPSAAVMIAMALLGAALFRGNSGFGIFKLSMYVQPFLMTTAVVSLCRTLRVAR